MLIADEPFGIGFDVTVTPPPVGVGHDRAFPTLTGARVYAGRLGTANGWPVIDRAEGVGRC